MSPDLVLGPALAEAVRELVRAELQRVTAPPAPARSPWMTPPSAARSLGVSVKAVRELIRDRRVVPRLRNASADPKQKKYLVHVDQVAAALEDHPARAAAVAPLTPGAPPIDLEARAARIRARAAGR